MSLPLFLYGTLRDPDVYLAVAGESLRGSPAALAGHKARLVKGRSFPALAPDDSNREVEGLLVFPGPSAFKRICHFEEEGVLYFRQKVEVFTQGKKAPAQVFSPLHAEMLGSEPWNYELWRQKSKEAFLSNAKLFMSSF